MFPRLSRPRLLVIACALCGALSPTAAQAQSIITAAVPPEGSTAYVVAAAISKTITDATPVEKVTLQTFGGAAGWPARMQRGEAHLGFHCGFKQVEEAYFGEGAFKNIGRQKNVRNMISGHGNAFAMSVTDNNATSLADLKGKTIFAMVAHQDHRTALDVIARYTGLEIGRTLKVIPVRSPQEALQGLLTGRGDGFMFGLMPSMVEVQQARGLHPLPMPEDLQRAIREAEPVWGSTVIKAGAPPLRPEKDVPTIEIRCGTAAAASVSDELIFTITKAIFENRETWRSAHPLAEQWTPARAVQVMNIPYHGGAVRYYKSVGVWTDAHERRQKELLAK